MRDTRTIAPVIRRSEIDGVPLLWAPADGLTRVALVFRVGSADEPFARGGLSHIVEHLAMFSLDEPIYQCNGFVDQIGTVFHASGEREEMAEFVEGVSRALSALPLERLEAEKRVLAAEASAREGGVVARLILHRCGLATYGKTATDELGLRCITEAEVAAWAAARFTKANAVICWAGGEPPQLTLALPAGDPVAAPPDPTLLPGLPLPLAVQEGTGGVAIGTIVERSTAASLAIVVAERRLHRRLRLDHGLVYSVDSFWDSLTAGHAHSGLLAECVDGAAVEVRRVLLEELKSLTHAGPTATEVEAAREQRERELIDDDALPSLLAHNAMRLLTGVPLADRDALLAELRSVDESAVKGELNAALRTAILMSPETAPPPSSGFASVDDIPDSDAVEGRAFTTRGLRRSRRDTCVIGAEGIALHAAGEESPFTIRWCDVVAATREHDGSYYLTGRDGTWFSFDPSTFGDADALRSAVEEHLDSAWIVPPPDGEAAEQVRAIADEQLPKAKSLRDELAALPAELEHGENLLHVAEAMRGWRVGLLAVTDRRTLFVCDYGELKIREDRHHAVREARGGRGARGETLTLVTADDEVAYWAVSPSGRAKLLAGVIEETRGSA